MRVILKSLVLQGRVIAGVTIQTTHHSIDRTIGKSAEARLILIGVLPMGQAERFLEPVHRAPISWIEQRSGLGIDEYHGETEANRSGHNQSHYLIKRYLPLDYSLEFHR